MRAFDARTGKQVWSFHTDAAAGEPGNETWGDDSWKVTGHTNVWAPMSLDAARGLLYLPVSTPSNDHFGGRRPGANLFGESIVCLDAATGAAKWYFQIVHHGLWDYDPASAPSLVTITVDGRPIDARRAVDEAGLCVRLRSRHRQARVADRRAAGATSDVPGEHAWPTQPFPTKPPAFTPQGMTLDDAFDLTPELKAAAQAEMKKVSDRAPLHAAVGAGHGHPSRHHRRRELGRRAPSIRRPGRSTSRSTNARRIAHRRGRRRKRAREIDAEFAGARLNAKVDAEWAGGRRRRPGGGFSDGGLPLTKADYAVLRRSI